MRPRLIQALRVPAGHHDPVTTPTDEPIAPDEEPVLSEDELDSLA